MVMDNLIYRNELPDDYRKVEIMTREAFWNVYQPGCTEHYILNCLRYSPDFIHELDFVAEYRERIVGNVVCVKSHINGDDSHLYPVLTLGPLSVHPEFQRQGIGRKLVQLVLSRAALLGHDAIMLCGDPLLYRHYGFKNAGKYGIRTSENKISPVLQIYPLNGIDLAKLSGIYFESNAYEIDAEKVGLFDSLFPIREKVVDTPTQLRFKELLP